MGSTPMDCECYRVKIPERSRLSGFTAAGQRVLVVPGEHVVHRVKPKVPLPGTTDALRFLGADARGRDVHVPVPPATGIETVLRQVAVYAP